MIQQKIAKLKGIADIVFCIDFSGSMESCIKGVKDHIQNFVNSLETTNKNLIIDWRLALCAYSDTEFYVMDFTNDTKEFSRKLASLSTLYNEFTPGAIDFSITHFDWRQKSTKILVVFTDETLETGIFVEESKRLFNDLLNKISYSKIKLFFYGPRCPHYSKFEQVSGVFTNFLDDTSFASVDFTKLLSILGKTVSQSCYQQTGDVFETPDYLFDFSKTKIIKI